MLSLFNNIRDGRHPEERDDLRGLLESAEIAATGGIEPPRERPTSF